MPVLVRKIDKGKWLQADIMHGDDVSADAVTNCMKTTDNALSTWIAASSDCLDEPALAIVARSEYLEAIDVVPLSSECLCEKITCVASSGDTPVRDLVETHMDLVCLSYKKLGVLAYHIADRIRDGMARRYTRSELKRILREAIMAGRLKESDLSESVRNKLFL